MSPQVRSDQSQERGDCHQRIQSSDPPWFKRRIIPIGYIIATEELDPALVDELIPKNRVITDTRKLVVYYRASPDRKRILFGGRVSLNETDPQKVPRPSISSW